MNVVLAMAWRFDSESVERFMQLLPVLNTLYSGISIVTPPRDDLHTLAPLKAVPNIRVQMGTTQPQNWRYMTVQQALQFEQATHIHYCDGDHVISRLTAYPDDWRQSVAALAGADCLIIGRSPRVFDSYPASLRETERIMNLVGSYLLGQSVDLGAGARGFSRRAAEHLIAHASSETHGVATDMEWPVILHRDGFTVETFESEGAVYEIVDEQHRQLLESPTQWAKRTTLAHIIIAAGFANAN